MLTQRAMYFLWFASPVLQTAILFLFIRRKSLRRDYPFFFAYNIFEVGSFILTFLAYQFAFKEYFQAYWTTTILSDLLSFLVIYEVFSNAFRPFDALRDLGQVLFKWAAVVLLIVAIVMGFTSADGGNMGRVMTGIFALERSIRMMQCGLLFLLLFFQERLGLTWKHYSFGIGLGMGAYAAMNLTLLSIRTQTPQSWGTIFGLVFQASYVAAAMTWAWYLARPEPARLSVESFGRAAVLYRWNQSLATVGAGDGNSSFIPGVEEAVERVLERRHVDITSKGVR